MKLELDLFQDADSKTNTRKCGIDMLSLTGTSAGRAILVCCCSRTTGRRFEGSVRRYSPSPLSESSGNRQVHFRALLIVPSGGFDRHRRVRSPLGPAPS